MRDSKTQQIVNGVLWGSAIMASAVMGGPQFLTLILLPALGFTAIAIFHKGGCCR